MSQRPPSLAEQDPTVARVAEASLRMMAGTTSPATRKRISDLADGAPDNYPWREIVDAVLADPADPSDLVQKGLLAQRDWVSRSASAIARPTPRSGPSLGYKLKRTFAVNLAKLLFYSIFFVAVLVLLYLVRRAWPQLDLYVMGDRFVAFFQDLFGKR
jgi:hypothetical protein